MSAPANGDAGVIRAAVAGAAAELAAIAAPAEQLDLLGVATRFRGPRAEAVQARVEREAKAGRPVGAQNISTRQFREYLLKMGVSPLVALMRFAVLPPDLLAAELGCTKLEAFREWKALQVELAPYLHSKVLPTDDDGKTPPFLQMFIGGEAETAGDRPPWQRYFDAQPVALESQQNQALSPPVSDVSPAKVSPE